MVKSRYRIDSYNSSPGRLQYINPVKFDSSRSNSWSGKDVNTYVTDDVDDDDRRT